MSIIAIGSAAGIKLVAAAAISCGFSSVEMMPLDGGRVALHVEGQNFDRVQCLYAWAQKNRPQDVDFGFRGSATR